MIARIVEINMDEGIVIFEGLSDRLIEKLEELDSCDMILQSEDDKIYYYIDKGNGMLPHQVAIGEILMCIDFYG